MHLNLQKSNPREVADNDLNVTHKMFLTLSQTTNFRLFQA